MARDTNPSRASRSLQRPSLRRVSRPGTAELSQRRAAPCLGNFRQLTSTASDLPRNRGSGASGDAAAPGSLLYRRSHEARRVVLSSRFFLPSASASSLSDAFLARLGTPPDRRATGGGLEEVVDRRHKEISRRDTRLPHTAAV